MLSKCELTDWNESVRCYRKFFDYSFWRDVGLSEVTQHLESCCFRRTVGCSHLYSVIYTVIPPHCFYIGRNLTVLELLRAVLVTVEEDSEQNLRTCKTVTGIRTPWSFHIAVIPRLRAIRPVRIEFGVHFLGSVLFDDVVVLLAEVDCPASEGAQKEVETCICLWKAAGRLHIVRSPSMSDERCSRVWTGSRFVVKWEMKRLVNLDVAGRTSKFQINKNCWTRQLFVVQRCCFLKFFRSFHLSSTCFNGMAFWPSDERIRRPERKELKVLDKDHPRDYPNIEPGLIGAATLIEDNSNSFKWNFLTTPLKEDQGTRHRASIFWCRTLIVWCQYRPCFETLEIWQTIHTLPLH